MQIGAVTQMAAPILFIQIAETRLYRLQLRQDNGGGSVVLEEHAVVDGHIGGAFLLEYLPLVGEDYGAVYTVLRRLEELGQRAVLGVVFTRLDLQR